MLPGAGAFPAAVVVGPTLPGALELVVVVDASGLVDVGPSGFDSGDGSATGSVVDGFGPGDDSAVGSVVDGLESGARSAACSVPGGLDSGASVVVGVLQAGGTAVTSTSDAETASPAALTADTLAVLDRRAEVDLGQDVRRRRAGPRDAPDASGPLGQGAAVRSSRDRRA